MNKFIIKKFFLGLLLTMLLPTITLAQIDYGCWGTINVYLLYTTTVTSQYDIPSGYEWKVKSIVWSAEKNSDSPYGDSYEITSQNGKTCVIKGRSFPSSGKLYCKMKYGDNDYIAYFNVNAISMGNLTITANPSGGTVNAGTKVYLTCNESESSIFYTTDGTNPIYNSETFQPTNGSLYNSSGITINQTTTIKAFAAKKGYESSSYGSWTFTVNQLATSVTLNKTSLSLQTGQSETLTATVLPTNATDKTITWSSSNTSVATVTSGGKVTAVAAGSATITCKANDGSGVSATCSVTVGSPNLKGDVNGDGEVNGTDLVALTNMILGRSAKTSAADVSGDGDVNGTDYVMLVNIILGK